MSVLVRITAPGIDASTYDQMTPALHPLLKTQPGFVIHIAYLISGGFAVGEVWDSRDQHETWFNENVSPNLPDPQSMSVEYIDLHTVLQP